MAELINMPKLGFDMREGQLVSWTKQPGDSIQKGDVVAEIESDKATVEVEAYTSGTLLEHLVKEGDWVPIGAPIAVIGEPGEEYNLADLGVEGAAAEAEAQPEPAAGCRRGGNRPGEGAAPRGGHPAAQGSSTHRGGC